MIKNEQLKYSYIAIFLVIFFTTLIAFIFVNIESKKDSLDLATDKALLFLRANLEKEKQYAISLAIALASNQGLKESLIYENDEGAYKLLLSTIENLKRYASSKINVQVITNDLFVFTRSWDNTYSGMPLDDFREDLIDLVKNKKPKVSIEVGYLLSIRAVVPIFEQNEFLGSLEVIILFEDLVEKFRNSGIELFVLMDEDRLSKALLMSNNPTINEFVIVNRNYNNLLLDDLKNINFDELINSRVSTYKNSVYIYEPMFNSLGQKIGAFVMGIKKNELKKITSETENISFLLNFNRDDIYQITKEQEYPNNMMYCDLNDIELLNLLEYVKLENRVELLEEAKKRLKSYSNDELIEILLNIKSEDKKIGEIR